MIQSRSRDAYGRTDFEYQDPVLRQQAFLTSSVAQMSSQDDLVPYDDGRRLEKKWGGEMLPEAVYIWILEECGHAAQEHF